MPGTYRVGTAGWSVPKPHAQAFPSEGSHLERYAARFPAVEINSSFYRPHRPTTYARWAATVPPGFRFAVKVPRELTHDRRLVDPGETLQRFLGEAGTLGEALGPLLIQLPPSLQYDAGVASGFLSELRSRFGGGAVCEPRHPSWFSREAERMLRDFRVARVAADPAVVPQAAEPGGWPGLAYFRLHGSPKIYHSAYRPEEIDLTARRMRAAAQDADECWCIFDNTALGEAAHDAMALLDRL